MSAPAIVSGLAAIVSRELAAAESLAQESDAVSVLLAELHLDWLSAQLNRLLATVGTDEVENLRRSLRTQLSRLPAVAVTKDVLKATIARAGDAARVAPPARTASLRSVGSTADEALLALSFLVRRVALDATVSRLHGDAIAVLLCDLQLRWLLGYVGELRIVATEERISSAADLLRTHANSEIRDLRARPSLELLAEGLARARTWASATPPVDAATLLLTDLDLSDLALSQIRLHNAKLFHSKLNRTDVTSVLGSGVSMVSSRLDGAVMTFGRLDRAFVRDCSFDRAELLHTDWRKATILSTAFDNARFDESSLDEIVFQGCSLVGTSFVLSPTAMVAERITFRGCDLTRSNWTGRNLSNVRFEGCHMSEMIVGDTIRDAVIERPFLDGRSTSKAEVLSALASSMFASRKGLSRS